jgi:hypothetical protein
VRYITLLEFKPGLTTTMIPPYSYLEKTNGTLDQHACVLRIDADGFMVSDLPSQPDDCRILLLGGSAIENLYIPEERRVAARIERIVAGWGKRAKTYSAGISKTNLLHMINTLVNKGLPLQPRLVVYYPTLWPDLGAIRLDNSFWNAAIGPIRTSGEDAPPLVPSGNDTVTSLLDEQRLLHVLCDICANFEIPLALATWPLFEYDEFARKWFPDPSDFEAMQHEGRAFNELLRQVVHQKGCALIDLARAFEGLDHHRLLYDLVHPNIEGCDRIASLTTEAIRRYL